MCVCVLVLPYMVNSICDGKAPNPKEELYIQQPLPQDQGSNHSEQMEAFIMATPNQCENGNEWVFSKFLKTSKPLIQFHLNIIITHKHTGDLVVKNLFLLELYINCDLVYTEVSISVHSLPISLSPQHKACKQISPSFVC